MRWVEFQQFLRVYALIYLIYQLGAPERGLVTESNYSGHPRGEQMGQWVEVEVEVEEGLPLRYAGLFVLPDSEASRVTQEGAQTTTRAGSRGSKPSLDMESCLCHAGSHHPWSAVLLTRHTASEHFLGGKAV